MKKGYPKAGAGRPKGARNKSTLAAERAAIEALQAKAAQVKLKKLAKDELAELVPVVKGIVARFQRAAMVDEGGSGAPGGENFKREAWQDLREWIKIYGWVADLAADFESPRYRAVAVALTPGDAKPAAPIIEHQPADAQERERQAGQAYLRLVKGTQ